MKPKVLFFLLNGVGGAERITITISNLFDTSIYDIKYVIVQDGDDKICQFINPELPIIMMPRRRIYLSTFPIYELLKKEKPQIVFCASPAINTRLILAARIVGDIRVVVRNSNMFSFERKDVQLLMKLTYRFADKIILQQDEMREELHKRIPSLPREKTITLLNPIDTDHIEEGVKAPNPFPKEESVNYLWVARFAHEKAQDVLVKAFTIVKSKISSAHLWFVGKESDSEEFVTIIKNDIKNLGLENCVHFMGYDSNPYKWMKHCDCFVLPSRKEGLPNVLIEAMYLGRPVVATRCLDIISDMVKNGVNGYTCSVESPAELADGMIKAILLKDCKMVYKPSTKEDIIKAIAG